MTKPGLQACSENINLMEDNMTAQSYISRGVSPTKDDVKKAVVKQDKGLFPGSFCKIIPDIAGNPEYCCAVHADGAGTKSSVAYMMYKETGNPLWFEGIAQDSLVMNTDDLICIGVTDNFYLSNTIGRNAHRVGGDAIASIISGYDKIISKMAEYGISITMTGGETADVGDLVSTVIADSTVVARIKRSDVIYTNNIKPGDVIVGLSSSGKAEYEDKYNSGIGSNGLTAARHTILHKTYLKKYPESVSDTIPEEKIYCGKYMLGDNLEGSSLTAAESILSPTRTYLPVIKNLFEKIKRNSIHGIIHCTGGGQVKCKDFGENLCYIKDNLFEWPALFEEIFNSGEVKQNEMYQIFNMGHRMEIYCDKMYAEEVISSAEKFGIKARIIGKVEDNENMGNKVIIRDRGMEFVY